MSDERHQNPGAQDREGAASNAGATSGGAGTGREGARTFTEEFRVSGEALLGKVKELIREGNIRRISIRNDEGRTLIEIPLTIGVIGTALLPVWAAIGAIAALVANLTLSVERVEEDAPAPPHDAAPDAGAPTHDGA